MSSQLIIEKKINLMLSEKGFLTSEIIIMKIKSNDTTFSRGSQAWLHPYQCYLASTCSQNGIWYTYRCETFFSEGICSLLCGYAQFIHASHFVRLQHTVMHWNLVACRNWSVNDNLTVMIVNRKDIWTAIDFACVWC